jgi:hypothetical protein
MSEIDPIPLIRAQRSRGISAQSGALDFGPNGATLGMIEGATFSAKSDSRLGQAARVASIRSHRGAHSLVERDRA